MKKVILLPILIISIVFVSFKSTPVPHPEYIKWRAQPKDFIISLFKGVLGRESKYEWQIENMANLVKSNPESRLKMFWTFISTEEYQASRWAKQKKEYQIYYKYVTSGSIEKYSYYVAKKPTGAHMSTDGIYTFGVAMAIRDYKATYNPRSVEFGN